MKIKNAVILDRKKYLGGIVEAVKKVEATTNKGDITIAKGDRFIVRMISPIKVRITPLDDDIFEHCVPTRDFLEAFEVIEKGDIDE